MVFTSFNFLIFFPLVVILYWITPARYRWLGLLIASYFFYINIKPVYALLLAGVTTSTWLFARLMDKTRDESRKKTFMVINIVLILLPLFFFKYFAAINNGLSVYLEANHMRWPLPEIKLMLPIGISFYTFMAIGYTIDVYNEEIEAEKNPGIVALFISFFPLILSGPIERAKNMLPQFRNPKYINYDHISAGLKMMLWGYFMKLVVADRLGIYVDAVYNNISQHNGTSLLFASILYPFQVYADLGGYSLIAIGVAKTMGIEVMQNFNRPFFATSMSEFWRRWHISLISWLTDYVYTPLSFTFRRYKVWGIVIALMLTFVISGIWHGAALTFVVWGLMQGGFLSIEALTNKNKVAFENKYNLNKKAWYIFLSIGFTFILFAASQVFGRAKELGDALLVFNKIFFEQGFPYIEFITLILGSFGLFIVFFKDYLLEYKRSVYIRMSSSPLLVALTYSALFYLTLLLGVLSNSNSFIYFQF